MQVLVGTQAADIEQVALAGSKSMPAEDGFGFGTIGPGTEDGLGALGDHADLWDRACPASASIATCDAWETVTIRSAQRAATASLSRQAIRPLSRGKTSSGWVSGSVSCIVTTSLLHVPDREKAVRGGEVDQVDLRSGRRLGPWPACRRIVAVPGPMPHSWGPRPPRPRSDRSLRALRPASTKADRRRP